MPAWHPANLLTFAALALLLIGPIPALAESHIATFSIVARDPLTGDLGVAVESKYFGVGSVVPRARADVGALATQARGNILYGPEGLDLLETGLSPEMTLERLLADDPLRAQRRIRGNWWLTDGWSWLQPKGGQPLAGDYRIKFGVLGLRYSLKDFDRFLYVNVQAEASRKANGSAESNVITAGTRWNF